MEENSKKQLIRKKSKAVVDFPDTESDSGVIVEIPKRKPAKTKEE